jgi:hypothetical protein
MIREQFWRGNALLSQIVALHLPAVHRAGALMQPSDEPASLQTWVRYSTRVAFTLNRPADAGVAPMGL